jgi:uncharacterized protein YmfQ (DUF2313 family)
MSTPWAHWEGTVTVSGLKAGSYHFCARLMLGLKNKSTMADFLLLEDFEDDGSGAARTVRVVSYHEQQRGWTFDDTSEIDFYEFGKIWAYGTPGPQGEPTETNGTFTLVSVSLTLVDYAEGEAPFGETGFARAVAYARFIDQWTLRVSYAWRVPRPEQWTSTRPTAWSPSEYTFDNPSITVLDTYPASDGFEELSTGLSRWQYPQDCVDLVIDGGTPGATYLLTGPAYNLTMNGYWRKPAASIWVHIPAEPLQAMVREVAPNVLQLFFDRALHFDPEVNLSVPFDLPGAFSFDPPGPAFVSSAWITLPPGDPYAVYPCLEVRCSGIARGMQYDLYLNDLPPRVWRAEDGGLFDQQPYPLSFAALPAQQAVDIAVQLEADSSAARARVQNDLGLIFAQLEVEQPGYSDEVLENYFANPQIGIPCTVRQSTTIPLPGHQLVLGHVLFSERPSLLPAALALLPPGRAFSKRLESMLARVLDGLVREPERVQAEALALRASISPRRASRDDYVGAWEEALGIPEPAGTLAERAELVAAKLRGQAPDRSLSAYQAAATAHGMTLTELSEGPAPFQAGVSRAGDPVPGDSWAFVFVAELAGGSALERASLRADYARRARAHTLVVVPETEVP